MRITVIGTGNVGGTLGRRWAEAGHDVTFGTRDPSSDKVKQLLGSLGGKARAAAAKEAAAATTAMITREASPGIKAKRLLMLTTK